MNTERYSTSLQNFVLRFASSDDTVLILDFIRELAEYEKMLKEVVADENTLKEFLFGKKVAEVIIGEYDSEPVSFALFFHNFSTFLGRPGIYIEDLFVKPEIRGKGIGKIMIAFLAKLAKERKCGRLEWWCLDWNNDAIQFYENLGALSMDEWTVFRLTNEELNKVAATF